MFNYRNNWYYPMISYILVLYITGSLILIGNLFANVILLIIDKKSEHVTYEAKPTHLYTDEEIMKDIDVKDAPFLAAALAIPNDGIWSHDKHFEKQNKVKVWISKELLKYI